MSSITQLFLWLAGIAYDLFYPMARLAVSKLGELSNFAYLNPFTGATNNVNILFLNAVDDLATSLGIGDISFIALIFVVFVSVIIVISIVRLIKWVAGGD